MRLRRYSTWEVVYERISEGKPIEEKIETLEDLAALPGEMFPVNACWPCDPIGWI